MRNQALSGLRVAAWTTVWDARVFFILSGISTIWCCFPLWKTGHRRYLRPSRGRQPWGWRHCTKSRGHRL